MPRTATQIRSSRLDGLIRPRDLLTHHHGDLLTLDTETHWVTVRFMAAVPKSTPCANPLCHRPFAPLKANHLYCSPKCKQAARAITLAERRRAAAQPQGAQP